jgi:ketosteroid isomerase-like protein
MCKLRLTDGVFHAQLGPEPDGATHQGDAALRVPYSALWAMFPDATWSDVQHFMNGNRAITEWRFTGPKADGTKVNTRGCDVFVFRDGKIAIKDTFRKHVV